jgi:hypothetical protein
VQQQEIIKQVFRPISELTAPCSTGYPSSSYQFASPPYWQWQLSILIPDMNNEQARRISIQSDTTLLLHEIYKKQAGFLNEFEIRQVNRHTSRPHTQAKTMQGTGPTIGPDKTQPNRFRPRLQAHTQITHKLDA